MKKSIILGCQDSKREKEKKSNIKEKKEKEEYIRS
jgi:hypothetical protein